MQEYTVTWEIQLSANSPKEAAKEALKIQREEGGEAIAFNVIDSNQKETFVDLLNEEETNFDEIESQLRSQVNSDDQSYDVLFHYTDESVADGLTTGTITEKPMSDFPESEDKFVFFDLPLKEAIEKCINADPVGEMFITKLCGFWDYELKAMLGED